MNSEILVSREAELARLDVALQAALQGRAKAVFVTGKAGAGKTCLIKSFLEQAQKVHPGILAGYIECNWGAGIADPFQPFDELIPSLNEQAGHRSIRWYWRNRLHRWAGLMSSKAKSAVGLLGIILGLYYTVVQVIIDLILAAMELGTTTKDSSQEDVPYRKRLDKLAELSHRWPLLICLDNFHHGDKQSCVLLKDLHQRLIASSVLLVIAFRPSEVGVDHPLYLVWTELVARQGQDEIKLDEILFDNSMQRRFIDEYLDTNFRPNTFDDDFRTTLTSRTEGLPWFVAHLMKLCEERHWVQYVDDCWKQIAPFGRELPRTPREFIKREGWDRLASEDQTRLKAAAIDGEKFTVSVVAEALEESLKTLRKRLDEELGRRNEWVAPSSPIVLNHRQLGRYCFVHTFYHEFADGQLQEPDRGEWHGRIGVAKKKLWAERWTDIAAELAYHFESAGLWKEALPCFEERLAYLKLIGASEDMVTIMLKVGDMLRKLGQPEEASQHYQNAAQLALEIGILPAFNNASSGHAWTIFEMGKWVDAEPLFRAVAEQQLQAEPPHNRVDRRILFALVVTQLAAGKIDNALASLDEALRDDDPDTNDRLDQDDTSDARVWLRQLQETRSDVPEIIVALQRLENEIGDCS